MSENILTTSNGNPVDDNQHVITVGKDGPLSMEDFHYIDKITHFDRERVPERVVHAKGSGAYGYFEVTKDCSDITKAKFLSNVAKRTPIFVRFSLVTAQSGAADTIRDPRGFSVKFYTEEGNWDAVANNIPVFFFRDPGKFPDLIHSQKKCPVRNIADPTTYWDFISLMPETMHAVTMLFSDRGLPDGYRFMHGFPNHTYKLVNDKGEFKYVKWHFKSDQGTKFLMPEDALYLAGKNPDYSSEDLFEAIKRGEYPSWTVYIQVMTQEDLQNYRFNPLDVTKVVSTKDFPLREIGRFTLNENPTNYFADVEQSAFSPSHMVPGIEATYDKMFQGRLLSYPDTQRYRLGANYKQIPVNSCKNTKVNTYQRDGSMVVTDNFGGFVNYEPNSVGGPKQLLKDGGTDGVKLRVSGEVKRHVTPLEDDDFIQPRILWEMQPPEAKKRLARNIANHLSAAKISVRQKALETIALVSKEYSGMVSQELETI